MVAIVSGHGLGLDLTSLRTLGPQEFTGNAAHGRNGQGVYVNATNGNLVVRGIEAFVTSIGEDVAAVRTYNSQGLFDDDNGNGDNWSNGYFLQPLKVSGTPATTGSTIQLTGRDGSVARFTWDPRGFYVTTDGDGSHDKITVDSAHTLYTWTDGTTGAWKKYDANAAYRLVSSGEPAGKVLAYTYGGTGQLETVLNSDGEGTRYVYENGRLTGLKTVKGTDEVTRVTYEYDAGRLAKVTVDLSPGGSTQDAADVYWTEYGYEGASHRVASIRQSDGTQLTFGYVTENGISRIASVANALQEKTTFDYFTTATGSRTVVTDPLGRHTTFDADTQGRLVGITAPGTGGVNPTRSFAYDAHGNLETETDGEGRVVTHVYDEWGNSVLQTDSAGGRVERRYDSWNQLIVETVYLKADPDGSGAGQAAEPASTRQFWSATVRGQLLFVVSAEGRVTEHRYDAHGQRTHTIEYLGAHYPSGHAPLVESDLAQWAAARDKTQTRLAEMTYDERGNLKTRTSFGRVSANGVGIDGTKSVETFVYDQRGLLTTSISATQDETAYTHDGLGRLETLTNALGHTSVTQYLDSQQKVVHIFPQDVAGAGLVSTSVYDLAGRHITTVQSGGGAANIATTHYDYDKSGRLRMVKDPTGRKQWIVYTDAGYKAAEIDANGTMTEYGYDASGRVAWTKVYDTAVNLALRDPRTATLTDLRPAATSGAHRTWHTYDAAGRLVRTAATIRAGNEAAVTEWRYDGASRLVTEVRYATAVAVTDAGFTTVPLPGNDILADRVTRHFHDRDGLLLGTLDAEGYLTELQYDSAGQLTRRIAHARATPSSFRESGAFTDLIPAEHPRDIRSDYFYDGHGRRVGELDGERYLTEHGYDANGRLALTLRYANAVIGEVATLQAARGLAGAGQTEDARTYDVLGRLASQTNREGTVTLYRYDTAGNLTATVSASGTEEERTRLARYDLLGRVIAELSPEHAARIRDTMTPAEVDAVWTAYGTTHTYDAAGRRTSTENSLGHRTFFYYNEDGALRFTVDAIGRVRERVYDGRGRLSEEIERVGQIMTADLTGAEAPSFVNERVEAAAHADDATVTYRYTRDGLVSTLISATGNPTDIVHNTFGEVLARTQTMGATEPARLEEYGYDRRGLVVETARDRTGIHALEKVVYDAFGRVTSTVDALGQTRSRTYDRLGRVVTTLDATGAKRETSYDAFSRTLEQIDGMGRITTFSYDVVARSVTVTTPEGIKSTVFTTRHGEESIRLDGLNQATTFTYDLDGRLSSTTTPVAASSTSYDQVGRVARTVDPNGNVVKYEYDEVDRVKVRTVVIPGEGADLVTTYAYEGRKVRVTDPAGVVTLTSYDKKGRVATQVVDENGLKLTTTYSYNPADQVLTVTNAAGSVTKHKYDALGRRESEIVDHGGLHLKRSWTYDDAGNVLTSTDPGGHVTRYAYDAEGRLQFTVGPLQSVTKLGYDANGNLVSKVQFATPLPAATAPENVPTSGADRKSFWAYDKDNRLVFEVDAMRALTERTYDKAGNVIRRTAYASLLDSVPEVGRADTEASIRAGIVRSAALDRIVRFAYDAGGRLKYTLDATGALHETRYDDGGLLVESIRYAVKPGVGAGDYGLAALAAAVVTSSADQRELYEYDALGRLVRTTDALGASETTAYNDLARTKTFTNKKGDTWTYIHDAAGRLKEERSPATTIAAMGGADSMSVSSVEAQVITRMDYDKVGNLTRRIEAYGRPEQRITTYGYDAAGRQVLVTLGSVEVYNVAETPSTTSVAAAEVSETLQIRTFYDAAGNAVANIDVGGALSQKTYDAAGRVRYEVDAAGYVTGYERNAFGEVTVLTRYARGTSLETRNVTDAGHAVTTAGVDAALWAVGVDHTNDRALTTIYDRAGRVTWVQEGGADTFDPTAAADLQWRTDRKTTDTSYNAFGEAIAVRSLRNAATGNWSVANRFYDANGREKASIDAMGYVTERTYDAFGNLASLKEYANAADAGWSQESYVRGSASTKDRVTEYEYDKGNRKVLERRRAVEYSVAADGTSVVGDLVTEYGYDRVGNQISVTDALNRVTRTYYDALGRVRAILEPQGGLVTANGGDPVAVRPLTTFLRDAHGNVLREVRHANGGDIAGTGWDYVAGAASSADRIVRTRFDRLGRALQVSDARGHLQYFSYDAYGKVAKKWQPLEDGTGRVTYEVNTYDKLGQLVSVRRPGTTMQVQGGITARWVTVPSMTSPFVAPPPGGELELGWTELEGARVRVEVTYTTPAYSLITGSGAQPTTTDYPARTVTVTQERNAAVAPGGLTVVFQDPVAKIGMIRVWELKGTTWDVRWEGTYAQAQGFGVTEVDQGTVEETVTTIRYNAFGEVTARLSDGVTGEYFHYDAAGRLWRTNTGDGVDKVYLYDAQGNRTSEIRSPGDARGNVDLRLVENAAEAHLDARNRRTDFAYDAAGRLVQKTEAARLESQGGLVVRQMLATATVQTNPQPIYVDVTESSGHYVAGIAKVKLTWTNLTVLGSGDVKVRVSYQAASTTELGSGGPAVFDSEVFASHEAAQGLTLSWTTKPIASITEITVWKKNSIGVWTEAIKQAPGISTYQIDLAAASNRWAAEFLGYRKAGTTGEFTRATLTDFGDRSVWSTLSGVVAGTYEYELGITPQGQDDRQVGTGTFTITASRTVTVDTTDNSGTAWRRPVIHQKTDRWGNVIELSDARADWMTVYAYNDNNQMVMQRLPTAGGVQAATNAATRIYYDALGRQMAVRDALGYVNATVYGSSGYLVREEHADQGVVSHRYNVFGEKVETTDARGNVQSFAYDKGGNLVKVTKGTAPVFDVGADLQLSTPITRAIEERWTYDALGRKLSHVNGENETISYRYDLLGNVIEVTQPIGQKTYAAFDAQGRKIAEVDANGYEATWRYDYFGKLLAHSDIGGATYQYTYDNARQLLKQTNTRGQQLAYKYDTVGQITEIRDTQVDLPVKVTTYAYDLSGRRLVEKTVANGEVHQDNRLAYDAQGKLRDVADTRVRMQLAYDANGNRTSVGTTVRFAGLDGEVLHKTTRYFQYDEMNRQIVVDAVDAAGTMDKSTHKLTYDKSGNRISDVYLGYAVVRNASNAWTVREELGTVEETYAYDDLNRLREVRRDGVAIDRRSYDAADRVMMSGGTNLSTAYLDQHHRLVMAGHAGSIDIRVSRYDANGRILHQTVKSGEDRLLQEISWDPNEAPREVYGSVANAYKAEGYDHAGNVKGYTVFTYEGSKTAKYSTTLKRYEGYVGGESTVTEFPSNVSGRNEQEHDANGHLIRVVDNHLTGNERSFVNDAQGRALSTVRGGHVQRQLIVNGEVMGRYGIGVHDRLAVDSDGYPNFTDVADFNFSFAPISATHPSPSPGAYIVQVDDTLQSIARGAYGDSALWYLIAQANGLSSDDDMRVGQVLNIPNRVGTVHNNDGTFKPYDPSKITGDLSPSLPLPGAEGCGGGGQVLMVIVAIIVTIYTAGAAAGLLGGISTAGAGTFASGLAVLGGGSAAGVTVTAAAGAALSTGAIVVGSAAIGAAVGSIASQAVGMAAGIVDRFDWKSVGLSALSAGFTAGIGAAGVLPGAHPAAVAGRAMLANAATQGIATAFGMQSSFNWKGVAAAGVGAAVGQVMGDALNQNLPPGMMGPTQPAFSNMGEIGGVLRGSISGFAAGLAAAGVKGGKVVVQQVAADAFGNALGSSLVDAMQSQPQALAQQGEPGNSVSISSNTQRRVMDGETMLDYSDNPFGGGADVGRPGAANGFNMGSRGSAPVRAVDPYAEFEWRRMQDRARVNTDQALAASETAGANLFAKREAINDQPFNVDSPAEAAELFQAPNSALKSVDRQIKTWNSNRVDLLLQVQDAGVITPDQANEMRWRQAAGGLALAFGAMSAAPLGGMTAPRPTVRTWHERAPLEVVPGGTLWNKTDTISPGKPWEQYVNRTQNLTAPEAPNFKTFDGFDFGLELGVSAKALNLETPTYMNKPNAVFNRVKGYVDAAVDFPGDVKLGFRVRPEDVPNRAIELAVPANPTKQQIDQLQRAIQYATEQGIKLNITKVK